MAATRSRRAGFLAAVSGVVFAAVTWVALTFSWWFVRALVRGDATTVGTVALVVLILVSLTGPAAAVVRWRSARVRQLPVSARIARSARTGAAIGIVAVVVVVIVLVAMDPLGLGADPLGLRLNGPPGAESSLENAAPDPWSASGRFVGYSRFTAPELNRIHQGKELRAIRYVSAQTPSTGPAVVSVNPISKFAWAAAALSDQSGRCYVILTTSDPRNPQYGDDRYGWLPRGAACVGASATRKSARRADFWPDE